MSQHACQHRSARQTAYLDKPGGVVPCKIGDDEDLAGWEHELGLAGLDKPEDGNLGPLGLRHARLRLELQGDVGLQGVVESEERVAGAQELPQGLDGSALVRVLGHQLELVHVIVEARHLGQPLLQGNAYLVERPGGVGPLVDDVAGRDNPAV